MKTLKWITWTVRVLLAAAFLAAGSSKIMGAAPMVTMFEHLGLGQWFRYVTGAVEVVGAILLLIPAAGFWGAVVLLATMLGAVATHLLIIGGNPGSAIVLGVLSAFVAYRLRPASVAARLSQPRTI